MCKPGWSQAALTRGVVEDVVVSRTLLSPTVSSTVEQTATSIPRVPPSRVATSCALGCTFDLAASAHE